MKHKTKTNNKKTGLLRRLRIWYLMRKLNRRYSAMSYRGDES